MTCKWWQHAPCSPSVSPPGQHPCRQSCTALDALSNRYSSDGLGSASTGGAERGLIALPTSAHTKSLFVCRLPGHTRAASASSSLAARADFGWCVGSGPLAAARRVTFLLGER